MEFESYTLIVLIYTVVKALDTEENLLEVEII